MEILIAILIIIGVMSLFRSSSHNIHINDSSSHGSSNYNNYNPDDEDDEDIWLYELDDDDD